MQVPRDLAPILVALHELMQRVADSSVVGEALRPQVPRITKHELPALEQKRVIKSRIGREASLHR